MGKVIPFPIRPARSGAIFCEPLGLSFPLLFRHINTLTEDHLAEAGVQGVSAGTYRYYTINENAQYVGPVERETVKFISEPDEVSLVIRYQKTEDEALAYLRAIDDFGVNEMGSDVICRTPDGIFTLIRRRTHKSWPSPLVIYSAFYPSDKFDGEEHWAIAVDSNGNILDGNQLRSFGTSEGD